MGNPWVGIFHTVPVPAVTAPVPGTSTHRIGAQGIVKKIWFHQGSNPHSHLPAVVFVKFDGYTGERL